MKIIYVGPLRKFGTGMMRLHALEKLGHEVIPIVTESRERIRTATLIVSRMMYRLGYPLDLTYANKRLITFVKEQKPDIVLIDKGLTIWPDTLYAIKKLSSKSIVVGYSPDDMAQHHNQSKYWLNGLSYYDVFFTTKTYNVAELRVMGAKCPIFIGNGYGPETHRPILVTPEERTTFGSQVGFIGAWEDDRAARMLSLASSSIKVRVWGSQRLG